MVILELSRFFMGSFSLAQAFYAWENDGEIARLSGPFDGPPVLRNDQDAR